MAQKGRIEYIDGPMFSGKTTELFRRVKRYTIANHRCVIGRYAKDTRYVSGTDRPLASSHDQEQMCALPLTDPWLQVDTLLEYDVIALDEAQFMGPDLVGFCEAAAERGKIVICSGLSSTHERKPWPQLAAVMPVAEQVTRLDAICWHCHGAAQFSRRMDATNTALEVIGGTDAYMASCRACWTVPFVQTDAHRAASERLRTLQQSM